MNQNKTFDVKYASDDLKKWVAGGKNLDYAMVYSGDFFDQLYILEEDGSDQYINMYVPDNTNLYFDAMVIPTTSKNPDLAYEFINFMLDTDNIVENVSYVGYCPCTKASIEALKNDEYYSQLLETYPAFYPGNAVNGEIYYDLGDDIYKKLTDIYNAGRNA
ncbi:MAG: extracellular solute-binding protein [Bacilli bacterium]